jgi:hypothetical protein
MSAFPPFTSSRAISYLDTPPGYAHFRDEYLVPLQPLIFGDENLPREWAAHGRYTRAMGEDRVPDIDAIAADSAGREVQVVVLEPESLSSYGDEGRRSMKVEEFADLWRAQPNARIYLKDFHLCLARPGDSLYRVYDLFQGA